MGAYDPAKLMIGSGPFYLESYVPGSVVKLGRRSGYFEPGEPYVNGVRQSIIPGEEEQVAQFMAGNLDVVRIGQSAMPEATATNPSARVVVAISDRNYAIVFPLQASLSPQLGPLFRDIRVRRAVSEALDRDAIGQMLYGGRYALAFAVNSTMGPWALQLDQLDPAVQQYYASNPAEAAELLQAAGALGVEVKLAYPAGASGAKFDGLAQVLFASFPRFPGTSAWYRLMT